MEDCDREVKHATVRRILDITVPDNAEVLITGKELRSLKEYVQDLEKQIATGIEFTERALRICDGLKKENVDLKETLLEMMQQVGH